MTRTKQKLILILALAMCFCMFSLSVVRAEGTVNQREEIVLGEIGDYSFAPSQFGYWYGNSSYNKSTETELIHHSAGSSVSAAVQQRGEFFLNMKMDSAISRAAENGFITVNARASIKSVNEKKLFDSADFVSMHIENGTYNGLSKDSFSYTGNIDLADSFETVSQSFVDVSLNLNQSLKGNGLRLRFYVRPDNKAYKTIMHAKNMRISLGTTDSNAPYISSRTISNNGYSNKSKVLKVDVNDIAGSGVHYIMVNGKKYMPSETASNTQNAIFNVEIAENGSYEILAYDNVGNVSPKSIYVEEKIDKGVPTMPVLTFRNNYKIDKTVEIFMDYADSGCSPSKVYYTLDNSEPTTSSAVLQRGDSIFNFDGGIYGLRAKAIDEAGNHSLEFSTELKCQTDLIVEMPIQEYTYSGEEIALDIISNAEKSDLILDARKNSEPCSLKNAGEYIVTVCGNDAYEGSFSFPVIVNKKSITIDVVSSKLTYNGQEQIVEVLNPLASVQYNISMQSAKHAGDYAYTIEIVDNNYAGSVQGLFSVEKATVEVVANYISKVYEQADPVLSYQSLGLVSGDILIGELFREVGETIGKYEILIGSLENANYDISYTANTFEIVKARAKVTAHSAQKIYGEKDSIFTYDSTCPDLVGYLYREQGENAGEYNIMIGELTSESYDIEFVSAKFMILQKNATIIANNKVRVYGESDPTLTYSTSGLVGSDLLLGKLARDQGEAVGTYAISQGTLQNSNYNLSFIGGSLTIERLSITVTANERNKVYGELDPVFTYSVIGIIGSDTLSGELVRVAGENAGIYEISVGSLANSNYDIQYILANLIIDRRGANAVISSFEKTYGENDPELAYFATGLLGEDILVGELLREMGENVGEYVIDCGTLTNSNYDITFENGTLTILKKGIFVTAENASKKFGDIDPVLAYFAQGLISSDMLSGSLERTMGENVGEYSIKQGTLNSDNYELVDFVSAVFAIEKSDIVLTIRDTNADYTGKEVKDFIVENPSGVSYIIRVYQEGKKISKAVEEGEYAIEAHFAGNRNYNEFTSVRARLVIAEKEIIIPPVEEVPPALEETPQIPSAEQTNPDSAFGGANSDSTAINKKANPAVIAGVSVGGGVVALGGGAAIFFFIRKRRGL